MVPYPHVLYYCIVSTLNILWLNILSPPPECIAIRRVCWSVDAFVGVFVSSHLVTGCNGRRAAGGSAAGGGVACTWRSWSPF